MSSFPAHRAGSLVALLTIAATLILSACGDDTSTAAPSTSTSAAQSDGAVSTTLDPSDTATTIPDLPDNKDPSAVVCTGAPQETFDATAIVGESIEDASTAASDAGCEVRVVSKDGKPLAGTMDFRPDRINVATENGQVTRIIDLG